MKLFIGIFCVVIGLLLIYRRASLRVWTGCIGLLLLLVAYVYPLSNRDSWLLGICYCLFVVMFNIKKIRTTLFSQWVFERAKKNLSLMGKEYSHQTSLLPIAVQASPDLSTILMDFKLLLQMMSVNFYAFDQPAGMAAQIKQAKRALASMVANVYLFDSMCREGLNKLDDKTVLMFKHQALKRMKRGISKTKETSFQAMHDFLFDIKKRAARESADFLKEEAVLRERVCCEQAYFFGEIEAIRSNNLQAFDILFFSHVGSFLNNVILGLLLSLSHGYLSSAPLTVTKRYFQQFDRLSFSFSLLLDVVLFCSMSMAERSETLTLLSDVLALILLGSLFIQFVNEEEKDERVLPIVDWVCQSLLFDIQTQMLAVLRLFPKKGVAFLVKKMIFPYGARLKNPSEALDECVANIVLTENNLRDRLLWGVDANVMEKNFELFLREDFLGKRLERAYQLGNIAGEALIQRTTAAVAAGLISQEEADVLLEAGDFRKKNGMVSE